ncbi:MAG: ABC transporter substrate-binding protein [Deltaproteobacteria bacterium]
MKRKRFGLLVMLAGALCLLGTSAFATDVRGVTDDEVKVGCLVDFTGPGKYAGAPISEAFKDCVAWVNGTGGVNGRKIKLIVEDNGIMPKIGMIYQDDGFGREGLEGAQAAAKFMKTKLVKTAPYKMGTIDFTPHMNAMKAAGVDFIVLWTYLPQSAAIIKQKLKMGWDVPLISNNTTGVPPLFALVGEHADGYMLVTPYAPAHTNRPGIQRVKEINKKYGNPEKTLENPMYPDYLYLAGWGYIETMVVGLKKAGRDLTPDALVKGLESIKDHDMGGMCPNITFGPKRHVSSFSSLVLRANGKTKQFDIIDGFKEPKTPQ